MLNIYLFIYKGIINALEYILLTQKENMKIK